jgi:PAS domain-containing protein
MITTVHTHKKNGARPRVPSYIKAVARTPEPDLNADANEMRAMLEAINKVQAVIEFELDGTVITANENFLKTIGYRLEEIKGQPHSMFVEPSYRASVVSD